MCALQCSGFPNACHNQGSCWLRMTHAIGRGFDTRQKAAISKHTDPTSTQCHPRNRDLNYLLKQADKLTPLRATFLITSDKPNQIERRPKQGLSSAETGYNHSLITATSSVIPAQFKAVVRWKSLDSNESAGLNGRQAKPSSHTGRDPGMGHVLTAPSQFGFRLRDSSI